MSKFGKICLSIIIGFSVLGVLGPLVFFFVDIPKNTTGIISAWVGIAGTAFSVILSIVAMCYSNKSSKDAEMSLKKITNHYEALCNELAIQEISKNLDDNSIESIISHNMSKLGKN